MLQTLHNPVDPTDVSTVHQNPIPTKIVIPSTRQVNAALKVIKEYSGNPGVKYFEALDVIERFIQVRI